MPSSQQIDMNGYMGRYGCMDMPYVSTSHDIQDYCLKFVDNIDQSNQSPNANNNSWRVATCSFNGNAFHFFSISHNEEHLLES